MQINFFIEIFVNASCNDNTPIYIIVNCQVLNKDKKAFKPFKTLKAKRIFMKAEITVKITTNNFFLKEINLIYVNVITTFKKFYLCLLLLKIINTLKR